MRESSQPPAADAVPRHIAITMDGNGRWAAARGLARSAGHKAGLTPVRLCVEECSRLGVDALTLFAFSSENWSRPAEEVASLMGLFLEAVDREIAELHRQHVRVRFIGAIVMCRDNRLPLRVFNLNNPGDLTRIVRGADVGTSVTCE